MKQAKLSDQSQKRVTIYRNLVEPVGTLTIPQLIIVITSLRYKIPQDTIQWLLSIGEKEKANEKKKKLLSFTASCQCSLWRSLENVTIYTSYVILDIDHLSEDEMMRIWFLLKECLYVYAAWRSPSFQGLKVIVETDAPMQDHRMAYDQVALFFEQYLKVKIDRSGSDICRLCFIGHDPEAICREGHEIFRISPMPPVTKPTKPRFPIRPLTSLCTEMNDYLFRKSMKMTNRKRQYYEGNRNNYIFLLSCYCRMNGLSKEDTLEEVLKAFNYSQREITAAVKSAFRYK